MEQIERDALLDSFALAAMKVLLAKEECTSLGLAKKAYEVAGFMLAVRTQYV